MSRDRIAKLIEFYEQNPDDPFTIYGLALEYTNTEPLQAKHYFTILLEKHPEYLPTYYHAAALFSELDEREQAEDTYQKGMALAQKSGDAHALKELQNAYTNFLYDD